MFYKQPVCVSDLNVVVLTFYMAVSVELQYWKL